MKKLVLISAVMLFAALGWTVGAIAAEDKLYSIQVRAVPMAEKPWGMATYRTLRDKGYLAYTYTAEIDGKPWLRVAVGVFDSIDEAADFGKSFSAKEKQDHFVAVAPVRITAGDGGDFVVTPSALWTRQGGKAREVFVFDDPAPKGFAAPGGIKLKPSPDNKAVAFEYGLPKVSPDGKRIYAVRLGDDKAVKLVDDYWGDAYGWSPSGSYISYIGFMEPEVMTNLWLVRADGSGSRALTDNGSPGKTNAVKGFVWHPTEDRILFIDGYGIGMVSVGGPIRSVDMEGNVKTVIDVDRLGARQELTGPLRIEDGYLHYRRVQFDNDFIHKTYTDERAKLSDL